MTVKELTKDMDSFLRALRRVDDCESSIAYDNEDGTIRFLIVHNAEGSAGKYMTFDVSVAVDEDKDGGRMAKIMDLDHDIWQEDEDSGLFEIESFEFLKQDPDREDVRTMMDLVNKTYWYKVCPCQKYLIKDRSDLCFFCELTATPEDLTKDTCPICLEDAYMMHLKKTPCCSQLVHRGCIKEWSVKGKTDKCALCRGSSGEAPPHKRVAGPLMVLDFEEVAARIAEAVNAAGLVGNVGTSADAAGTSTNTAGASADAACADAATVDSDASSPEAAMTDAPLAD